MLVHNIIIFIILKFKILNILEKIIKHLEAYLFLYKVLKVIRYDSCLVRKVTKLSIFIIFKKIKKQYNY